MKNLIIINGTPGIGKTTVCKELYKSLNMSVWLDGDWCWMMNPFIVNEENKRMVEDNITHLLRNFLNNSSFNHVIFNWVIHKEYIYDILLNKLTDLDYKLYKITLMCSEDVLRQRMIKDSRPLEKIEYSIENLNNYKNMDTVKIDTTNLSIQEVVQKIETIIERG